MSSPNFLLLYFLMMSLAASSVTDPPDMDRQRNYRTRIYRGGLTWHMYVLRWDGSHSAEVNENINLGYSQDQGYF